MPNVPNHRKTRNVNSSSRSQLQAGGHALKNVVIPLELPPAGYALLKTIAIQGGCSSVEEHVRRLIFDECQAFTEAMADEESPALRELLTVNAEEVPRL